MIERWTLAIVLGFLLAPAAVAGGFVCRQDCTTGACAQAACAIEEAGTGFCRCAERAVSWREGTYASWCRSWVRPAATQPCAPSPTAEEKEGAPTTPGLGQPDLRLADSETMLGLLTSKNPYVAALLGVLIEDGSWVEGPIEGQIHDSRFNEEAAALAHAPALRLTGLVVTGGVGAAQVQVTLQGDLGSFTHLRELALAATPSALVPSILTGTVTDRGAHGTLVVTAGDGKSETLKW